VSTTNCARGCTDPAAIHAARDAIVLALWIRYTRRRPSRASGSRLGARP